MASVQKTITSKKEEEQPAVLGGKQEATPAPGKPVHITDETFEEVVLKASVPALLDFWAPWCAPCRLVAPVVEDLARIYGEELVVAKINTDENVQVAGDYGILGLPTLLVFKDGREVDRIVGFTPRKNLEARLEVVLMGEEDEQSG